MDANSAALRTEARAKPSIGSVGDSYDNAMAESIIGLFKTEVIRFQGPWRNRDAVGMATLEWVDWYNNRRLFEALGDIPPAEAESAYYATMTPSKEPSNGRTNPPLNPGVNSVLEVE